MNPNENVDDWESQDEKKYEKVANEIEKRRFDNYQRLRLLYAKSALVSSLDKDFLVGCGRKFLVYSYFINFAGILSYFYLKTLGMKRWKRFMILIPSILVLDAYCLCFWTYFYPLKQYEKGLVRFQTITDNKENKLI